MLLSFCVVYLQSNRMHDSRFSFLTCTYHDRNAQDAAAVATHDFLESILYMCKACSAKNRPHALQNQITNFWELLKCYIANNLVAGLKLTLLKLQTS